MFNQRYMYGSPITPSGSQMTVLTANRNQPGANSSLMPAPFPPSPHASNANVRSVASFLPPTTVYSNARASAPLGPPSDTIEFHCTTAPNTRILVYTADITRLHVDAVVNPVNGFLDQFGSMSSAILAAAGYQLQLDCNQIMEARHRSPIPVCQNVWTNGGKLPVRFVIHAVGPDGYLERDEHYFRQMLASTFENVFLTAQELHISSLVMPLISSGALVKLSII